MAYYYSASERAFFSSEFMTVGEMPADKVAVADGTWKTLVADQSAGKIIRTGASNAPESAAQSLAALTGYAVPAGMTVAGGVSASGTLTATGATTLKSTLSVAGKTTLKDVSAAGISGTTVTTTGNASIGGTLAAVGAATLKGTLNVAGKSTLKDVEAASANISGDATVAGSFTVKGKSTFAALDAYSLSSTTGVSANGTYSTAATTMLSSTPWTGVVNADASRPESRTRILCQALDANGMRFFAWELAASMTGARQCQAVMRNRANTGWVFPFKVGDDANGQTYVTTNGQFTHIGNADITGDVVTTANLVRKFEASNGGVVLQKANITKGELPSVAAFWDWASVAGDSWNASARVGAVSTSLGTNGDVKTRLAAYEWKAGSTAYASIDVGYSASGKAWTSAPHPVAQSSDNSIATTGWSRDTFLPLAGGTVTGQIQTNREVLVNASTGFEVKRSDKDFTTIPSETVQTWFARVKDKNNKNGMLFKHYQSANGSTSIALSDVSNYGEKDDWATISIGHDAAGKQVFTLSSNPEASSNSMQIATTAWCRRLENGIMHTWGDESIAGNKTFGATIANTATVLIASAPWTGISIADASREREAVRSLAMINDADGKRFMNLEATASRDGSRNFCINGRKRDDSNWIQFFKIREDKDGFVTAAIANSPAGNANDTTIPTTYWVNQRIQSAVPTGTILAFDGQEVPSGYLVCNGAAVSRTTYAALFAVLGTRHGEGDGKTTFNLPNAHRRFLEMTTTTSEVGETVEAGLPNITGQFRAQGSPDGRTQNSGAFANDGKGRIDGGLSNGGDYEDLRSFNASRCSALYGGSSTVQPPSLRALAIIKF